MFASSGSNSGAAVGEPRSCCEIHGLLEFPVCWGQSRVSLRSEPYVAAGRCGRVRRRSPMTSDDFHLPSANPRYFLLLTLRRPSMLALSIELTDLSSCRQMIPHVVSGSPGFCSVAPVAWTNSDELPCKPYSRAHHGALSRESQPPIHDLRFFADILRLIRQNPASLWPI
jgi:hypothetical protein